MDFFSHAIWGATVVRKRSILGLVLLFAVLPDILGTVPSFLYYLSQGIFDPAVVNVPPSPYIEIYYFFHSLTFNFLLFLILFFFFRKYILLSLAYFTHLAVDIPTHAGDFGLRIFYPFSDFHFNALDWWESTGVTLANFAALILINLIIWLIRKKKVYPVGN